MIKNYECLDCGATMSSTGDSPVKFVDSDGKPVGCAFCGSVKFKPILEQLPPEQDDESN